jgi:hypothetical protein
MTHALALVAVAAALAPPPSPVPDEVSLSLPRVGIEVADAADVVPRSLPVRSQRAVRIAWKTFGGFAKPYTSGWVRVGRVTVHLVRIVRSSWSGLVAEQVVRLVVIRDATIPILGGRGAAFYVAPLAVFVRTDEPRSILAASF